MRGWSGTIGVAALALAACSLPSVASPDAPVMQAPVEREPLVPVEVVGGGIPPVMAPIDPEDLRGPAPPISGGTMLATRAGLLLVGDELTRRLYVVDPGTLRVSGALELSVDETPGRMAEDGVGMVHVVLPSAGALLRVDPAGPTELGRSTPCAAPRGVAYDRTRDLVHVACAGGELVSLTARHEIVREVVLDPDLRDVVAGSDRLFVSRFRSAEVLMLDPDGVELARLLPPEHEFPGVEPPALAVPRVAWRMRERSGGGVLLAHQHEIATDLGPITAISATGEMTYRASSGRTDVPRAIVEHRLTSFDATGRLVESVPTTDQALLVDVAEWGGGVIGAWAAPMFGPPQVAVEPLSPDRFAILYQSAQTLVAIHLRGRDTDDLVRRPRDLTALDPGQAVFHARSAAGIACASCHPGGHEDGHTWVTPDVGGRRSQSLLGGLRGTEPFHWGGELASFDRLMDAQSTRLMRTFTVADRERAFDWLDGLPAPLGAGVATAEGEAAFTAAGCETCHAGARLSDEQNHDVGAGPIQTPRLPGVLLRAPWLHDGCAQRLEETIDGTCRPVAEHGVADPALRELVVEYLRSL